MKKILLACNQPIFVKGLSSLLKEQLIDVDIDIAKTSGETMAKLLSTAYQLVIISIEYMGVGLAKDILKASLGTPILFYADSLSLSATRELYKNGVLGVLSPNADLDILLMAVEQVMAKQFFMTEAFKKYLLESKENAPKTISKKLTNREAQIAELMLKGEKLTEIGKTLHLKISTISTVKARIFKKLGITNLLELDGFNKKNIA
jgi:DNA-binding NarL/FixJ family response regulator